ncbi:MAG: hypothetical protein MSP55_06840 [Fusobacterium necrophorum]|nr:hypothetical protein [Fusobacterium necrophorum]
MKEFKNICTTELREIPVSAAYEKTDIRNCQNREDRILVISVEPILYYTFKK